MYLSLRSESELELRFLLLCLDFLCLRFLDLSLEWERVRVREWVRRRLYRSRLPDRDLLLGEELREWLRDLLDECRRRRLDFLWWRWRLLELVLLLLRDLLLRRLLLTLSLSESLE